MIDVTVRARRSPWLRAAALASAFALTLASVADGYGLHRCPHHDAVPGAPAAAVVVANEAGHDHGRAHDPSPAVEAGAAAADATHDPAAHEGGCTCVGECPDAAGATAPLEQGATRHFAKAVVAEAVHSDSDSPLASHVPHFLPFAHGPPPGL